MSKHDDKIAEEQVLDGEIEAPSADSQETPGETVDDAGDQPEATSHEDASGDETPAQDDTPEQDVLPASEEDTPAHEESSIPSEFAHLEGTHLAAALQSRQRNKELEERINANAR